MSTNLTAIFRPRSIAFLGGSHDPRSMSATLLRNLRLSFGGSLHLVNPRAAAAGEPDTYGSIRDVPGDVDLAVVAVPGSAVLAAVRDCVSKGVRAIVMISAGFAETGAAGAAVSQDLLQLIRSAGVRMVGPNCLGVVSTHSDWPLNASFGPADPPSGSIAVATQSGALGFVLLEYLRLRGLGIDQLVSLGNKLDLNECDVLEYWLDHSPARVFSLYLESLPEPRRLLDLGRRLSQRSPVVLLKTGRTATGQRAAGSHTAALAAPDRLVDGLARQAGFLRAESLEELCEVTSLLARQPPPGGRRAIVLTNAGGPGVMATDVLAQAGWQLPELSVPLKAQLTELASSLAAVRNPVDLVGTVDPDLYGRCLELLLDYEGVDAIVPIYVPRLPDTSPAIARAIHKAVTSTATTKTVAAVFMEGEQELARLQADCPEVPCFQFPDEAMRALDAAQRYAIWRSAPDPAEIRPPPIDAGAVRAALAEAVTAPARQFLPPEPTLRLLEALRLPTPSWRIATSLEHALAAAEQIAYPLVLKAIVPGVVHKAAAGGVVLDIRNPLELEVAWQTLAERFAGWCQGLIQQFRPGGTEVLVGVQWEPGFGHAIALGAGGIAVERRQQVIFRLAPLTPREVLDLIRESPVADVCWMSGADSRSTTALTAAGRALLDLLLRVSALLEIVPGIRELDLNPVTLGATDPPLRVLDARILLAAAEAESNA